MPGIRIHVDASPVEALLQRLAQRAGDLSPVMEMIGETLVSSTQQRFEDQRGPDGRSWKPSIRAVTQGGQTLVHSARLRNSITASPHSDRVEVGTNVIYAAIHQFGGRTRPHVIRPLDKKALAWPGGGPVKKVNHPGSNIPARPFLGVSDEDWTEIEAALHRYLGEEA